jgi:ankyrin repeat protein
MKNLKTYENQLAEKGLGMALLNAAEQWNIEDCRKWLDAGADVNSTDAYGRTALHVVLERPIKKITVDIIRLLLERGANPTLMDNRGKTALGWAARNMEAHTRKIIRMLVDAGADLNSSSTYEPEPIAVAVGYHNADAVKELIELGADFTHVFPSLEFMKDWFIGGLDWASDGVKAKIMRKYRGTAAFGRF